MSTLHPNLRLPGNFSKKGGGKPCEAILGRKEVMGGERRGVARTANGGGVGEKKVSRECALTSSPAGRAAGRD